MKENLEEAIQPKKKR